MHSTTSPALNLMHTSYLTITPARARHRSDSGWHLCCCDFTTGHTPPNYLDNVHSITSVFRRACGCLLTNRETLSTCGAYLPRQRSLVGAGGRTPARRELPECRWESFALVGLVGLRRSACLSSCSCLRFCYNLSPFADAHSYTSKHIFEHLRVLLVISGQPWFDHVSHFVGRGHCSVPCLCCVRLREILHTSTIVSRHNQVI
jgi:hypothetical protein